jgi:hypothetical protein
VNELRLDSVSINKEDWAGFADTLSKLGLTRLYLYYPDAADDVDTQFKQRYLNNLESCRLRDLTLEFLRLDDIQVWMQVVEALRNTPSLVTLNLGIAGGIGELCYPSSRGIARAVAALLKANPWVQEVAFEKVRFDTRPCKRMASALRQNKTLKTLKFCDCGMRGPSFVWK